MARLIVADTSWVAALRDPADAHHADAVASHVALGDELVALASLTLSECLVGPARLGVIEEAEAALRDAFEICVDDDSAPRRWALRRAETGLKLPDAVVLETALREGAAGIATFNARLARAARAAGLRVVASD